MRQTLQIIDPNSNSMVGFPIDGSGSHEEIRFWFSSTILSSPASATISRVKVLCTEILTVSELDRVPSVTVHSNSNTDVFTTEGATKLSVQLFGLVNSTLRPGVVSMNKIVCHHQDHFQYMTKLMEYFHQYQYQDQH